MPRVAAHRARHWAEILGRQEHPALIIGAGRKVLAANARFRARFTGGEDPAGRFCFQVMHSSRPPCAGSAGRCPLELESAQSTPVVHRHLSALGSSYEQVTARRLTDNGDTLGAYLLVTRPLAPTPNGWFLAGTSLAVLGLLERVAGVAAEDHAVSIRGEPGTGRAGVGRLLHDMSSRAEGPFVPADCSAVDGGRLEGVLFGRPKPVGDRSPADRGLYAAAAGGTLFLREPHLLPPSLQRRVGLALENDESACRWVFASDQAAASPRGGLRTILASARSLLVPPLRDRLEDLPLLLEILARRFGGAHAPAVDTAVAEILGAYSFPGNLRELECLIERACLVAGGGVLSPEHLPLHLLS